MTVTQEAFRRAVFDPRAAVPEGLTDPAGRPAGKRFDVYRNNVIVSLSNALAEAFPVIARLLGDNNFRILAGHYVRAHPPASPLMMFYGAEMPAFLETFEPVRALGYLPDVARLELALRHAYHAADADPLDPAALMALPADRLAAARLRFAPALRLVRSDWPVVAIWRFNMENGPKPAMRPEAALVTRPGYDPQIAALDSVGAACVAALMAGETLDAATDAGAALDPAFDPSVPLGALISGAALTALDEDPTP